MADVKIIMRLFHPLEISQRYKRNSKSVSDNLIRRRTGLINHTKTRRLEQQTYSGVAQRTVASRAFDTLDPGCGHKAPRAPTCESYAKLAQKPRPSFITSELIGSSTAFVSLSVCYHYVNRF